ncbi:hypothetical protein B484DRAFT_428190 [Ochromonadaceae sp. CCMP2298]|nr:hypothetical protein B484DRAFT_428190 [Ochromonadaceae sp. CCMP2298]
MALSIGSALWLLLLLCLWSSSSSLRLDHSTKSSKVFGEYVVSNFGMTVGGVINIDYHVTAEASANDSYVLLLLVSETQSKSWYEKIQDEDSVADNIDTMCNLPSMLRRVISGAGSINVPLTYDLGTDRYSIVLLQCRKGNAKNPVSVTLNVEMKNPRPYSSEYSQYAIQSVMLVRLLEGQVILYALLTLGMAGQIAITRIYTRPIHWLFLATLVSVFLFVTLRYAEGYRYNESGRDDIPLTVAGNILGSISTTLLLASLLLVSMGWSLVRTNITLGEQQKVAGALFAFFVFSFGDAVCLDDSSACFSLNLIAFIIRALILLAIIIAMNFTVAQLRAMIAQSPWVPSTPIQYARSKQYQAFRFMFILYLLLPTAFLIIEVVMFTWKEEWVTTFLTELLDLMLIFHVGVTFSPLHETLLVRAFDGTALGNGDGAGGVGNDADAAAAAALHVE